MTPDAREAFFTVHRDLPREGPGTPGDVHWALGQLGLSGDVRILDAGCGPGADLETLADALPEARLHGLDGVEHFVNSAKERVARFGPRVSVSQGDMSAITGPYDLIWCAGALYFLGVTEGLQIWRKALQSGGAVVFSEPVLLSTPATDGARRFWHEYPQITDLDGIKARVDQAGFTTRAHRMIVGAPWQAYYEPMQSRIDMLRDDTPDAALIAALDENQQEIDHWMAAKDDIAYALLIVSPT